MISETLRTLVQTSLDDARLSRAERSAILEQIQSDDLSPHELGELRSSAFAAAREKVASGTAPFTEVLDWLEEVTKVLHRQPQTLTTETAEAWFSPHDACPQRIRTALNQTRQTADICVFTITDDRLTESVLDAHRRGVRVRIITDNDKAADLGSDADRFLEAGIELRIDRTQWHMHHKFAIFDGSLLLNGSYNWTRGAAENNEENFLLLSHRKLVMQFAEAFEKLWSSLRS